MTPVECWISDLTKEMADVLCRCLPDDPMPSVTLSDGPAVKQWLQRLGVDEPMSIDRIVDAVATPLKVKVAAFGSALRRSLEANAAAITACLNGGVFDIAPIRQLVFGVHDAKLGWGMVVVLDRLPTGHPLKTVMPDGDDHYRWGNAPALVLGSPARLERGMIGMRVFPAESYALEAVPETTRAWRQRQIEREAEEKAKLDRLHRPPALAASH